MFCNLFNSRRWGSQSTSTLQLTSGQIIFKPGIFDDCGAISIKRDLEATFWGARIDLLECTRHWWLAGGHDPVISMKIGAQASPGNSQGEEVVGNLDMQLLWELRCIFSMMGPMLLYYAKEGIPCIWNRRRRDMSNISICCKCFLSSKNMILGLFWPSL